MTRLTHETLQTLKHADVQTPAYDRSQARGIVHLGTGAFHRAHQAAYFDALMARGEKGWMIQGASLRSAQVALQMNPQDGLYTMVVRDGEAECFQVLGSIANVIVAPYDPEALVLALADSSVSLVTLTITEKGYCIDPASGRLRTDDPDVRADIEDGAAAPKTAPGFLVAGLRARREKGVAPFTVLSCDNLPENGRRTRDAVIALARAVDPDLASWIEQTVAFPSSMVDRIVPATADTDISGLEGALGYRDEAIVKTEPFTQWVIEEWFTGPRPPLETVGVQFTDDVSAWEKAKLRLLNGSHSALAYLGALAGHDFVHEAIGAPGFSRFVNALWDEAQETLDPISGFDPVAYREALSERFNNAALRHRTVQIAMDGSQKLPQRLLSSIRDRIAQGQAYDALALATAAWIRWQFSVDEKGKSYTVDDPLSRETARKVSAGKGDPAAIVEQILSLEAVFDKDLARDTDFAAALTAALTSLMTHGSSKTVAEFAHKERVS